MPRPVPSIRTTALAAATFLACGAAHGAVALFNGDFEGTGGFSSDYAPVTHGAGTMLDAGETAITVGPSPRFTHPSWVDPAGAAGNMLIVNGATAPGAVVWSQRVDETGPLAPAYVLSAFFANVAPCCGNPAVVRFTVDGIPVGDPFTVASDTFTPYSVTFSPASTSFKIRLIDTELAGDGNDFALDSMTIAAVPEPHEWAMLLGGLAVVGVAARTRRAAAPRPAT